jgi:cytochrome c-type biogenesis protein CcmH
MTMPSFFKLPMACVFSCLLVSGLAQAGPEASASAQVSAPATASASASAPPQAGVAQALSADPALEKRVLALSETLRCLVCQNQTIADSHADLAIDLRNQVREKMVGGWSDQQVLDYMVQRYGDFVLYKPPVKGTTWVLWFGPFLLFFVGLGFLLFKLKQQTPAAEPSAAELQRAQDLLGEQVADKDAK